MLIEDEAIKMMLKKVAVVREQLDRMCLAKQGPILSVMDLHHVVQEVYGLKIEMLEVDFTATYLRGKVERYADQRARVLVRANLSFADKRLVTVKELSHLVIDEKDDWSTDGGAMLDNLIEESRSYNAGKGGVAHPTSPLQSEALALIAAGELLYPSDYRSADTAKLDAGQTTLSQIALFHKVPPFVVDQALENEDRLSKLRGSSTGIAKAA